MFRKKIAIVVLAASAFGILPLSAQAASGSGTGKPGDVPVVPGLQAAGDYETNAGSGTSKGGDVPVVPGFQNDDEYTTNSTGTSKGGDTPVVTG